MWVVGVGYRDGQKDPVGENTKSDIVDLGFSNVSDVRTLQTYVIEGNVSKDEIEKTGKELLADGVIQYFNLDRFDDKGSHVNSLVGKSGVWAVEVFFRKGVMDAVGLSVERALGVIGIKKAKVKTGTIYMIRGEMKEDEVKSICEKCLTNEMIHTYRYHRL